MMKDGNIRVLVTGSRGKSSIVRMLHTAFGNAGMTAYARITGVVPREFVPSVVSQPAREATARLRRLGFQVNTETVPVVDRPPGFVFAQARYR